MPVVSEWEWDPDTYLAEMADEIPGYEELQDAVASAAYRRRVLPLLVRQALDQLENA